MTRQARVADAVDGGVAGPSAVLDEAAEVQAISRATVLRQRLAEDVAAEVTADEVRMMTGLPSAVEAAGGGRHILETTRLSGVTWDLLRGNRAPQRSQAEAAGEGGTGIILVPRPLAVRRDGVLERRTLARAAACRCPPTSQCTGGEDSLIFVGWCDGAVYWSRPFSWIECWSITHYPSHPATKSMVIRKWVLPVVTCSHI